MRKFFIGLIILIIGCSQKNELKNYHPSLVWDFDLTQLNFTMEKEVKNNEGRVGKLTFLESNINKMLLINERINVNDKTANQLFSAKMIELYTLFTVHATPYSGEITNKTECLNEASQKPVIAKNDREISYSFNLRATNRFVVGVCQKELNSLNYQLQLLYCKKSSKFYELKLFYSGSSPSRKTVIANCRD